MVWQLIPAAASAASGAAAAGLGGKGAGTAAGLGSALGGAAGGLGTGTGAALGDMAGLLSGGFGNFPGAAMGADGGISGVPGLGKGKTFGGLLSAPTDVAPMQTSVGGPSGADMSALADRGRMLRNMTMQNLMLMGRR